MLSNCHRLLRAALAIVLVIAGVIGVVSLVSSDRRPQSRRRIDLANDQRNSDEPSSSRLTAQADPLLIKKVATWEELLNQPAIDLRDGVKIRFGIEALECPRWSSVALYAYTEGYDDMIPRYENRDALGPVWVSVRLGDVCFDAKDKIWSHPRYESEIGDRQPRLFCRFLMVDKVGDYEVTVRSEKGDDLARVTLKGTDAPFHPWSPLVVTKNTQYEHLEEKIEFLGEVGYVDKYRRTAPAEAIFDGKGIALPAIMSNVGYSAEGWDPLLNKFANDPKKLADEQPHPFGKGPLPKVLVEDIDPSLPARFVQERMLIQIVAKDRSERYRPGKYYLCRWWVNGKPFVPEPVNPTQHVERLSYPYNKGEDLEIHLTVTAKDLKAKTGDKVELQLLSCGTAGWLPVENPQTSERGGIYPRLTNKVQFTLP